MRVERLSSVLGGMDYRWAQRAALDAKMDVLLAGGDLPPNLMRGPVRQNGKSYPHTFKLTVNGNVALRPLACRGPFDIQNEWTILVPAIEVGRRLDDSLLVDAEKRRLALINHEATRVEILLEILR